jgi:SAM-dependent methyltransferase
MKICGSCGQRFGGQGWACPSCGHTPRIAGGIPLLAPELADKGDGYEARFFPRLAELEESNFWFRSRNRLIIWALRRYFPRAKSFLELGCGTGYVLSGVERALPGLRVAGGELITDGLRFAGRRLARGELLQMDARRVLFENEFDVIGAFDLLEHMEEDEAVFREMHRAVTAGGGIIVTTPQSAWLWSQADDFAHHVRRYTGRELRAKIERAGFRIARMTSFVALLVPLLALSRLARRRHDPDYDPTAELRIAGARGAILERIMDCERALLRAGISFPLGGSLFAIAMKQ